MSDDDETIRRSVENIIDGVPAPVESESHEEPTAEIDSNTPPTRRYRLGRLLEDHWDPYRRLRWFVDTRRVTRRGSEDFWHVRDPQENQEGRLPEQEAVALAAVWVSELYTPSTVGGLLSGIKDLGSGTSIDLVETTSSNG